MLVAILFVRVQLLEAGNQNPSLKLLVAVLSIRMQLFESYNANPS